MTNKRASAVNKRGRLLHIIITLDGPGPAPPPCAATRVPRATMDLASEVSGDEARSEC